MSDPRVYISGPMTGMPDFNYPAFYEAEERLFQAGYEPVNPARHFGGRTDLPREVYMRADIKALMSCEGVWMLTGWRTSKGADLEYKIARELGLVVEDYPFMLEFDKKLNRRPSRDGEAVEARDLSPCLNCGKDVPLSICGRVAPCAGCGTKYPHGDCSD